MKNYSEELLHVELTSHQKEIVKAENRLAWNIRFFGSFVMPAITGVSDQQEKQNVVSDVEKPSDDEIIQASKIDHFGQVLPIEDVEKVIDMVNSITRMPCGCRFKTIGKTDKRYCFGLGIDKWGILGKFPDSASSLEVLDKQETKKIIRKYDEEGLIHSIWTGVTPYIIGICNCDHDCLAYRGYIENDGLPIFFRAEYICEVDWELCTGCKSCMSQCQFDAIFYSSTLSKVYINPKKCFGCGLCRAACQNEAIRILSRQKNPETANIW
jgi:ferredoxin